MLALWITAATWLQPAEPGESLRRLERLRGVDPEGAAVLVEYADALGEGGDADGQLAFLLLALDAMDRQEVTHAREHSAARRRIEQQVQRLDPGHAGLVRARERYLRDLREVLRLHVDNQQHDHAALEIGARILRLRPDHPAARELVQQALAEGDAEVRQEAQRLLTDRELHRSRAYQDQWARDHRDWKNAGILGVDRYEVHTNIDHATLQRAASILRQVTPMYRSFYGTDDRLQRGNTRVHLYASRSQFEEHTGQLDPELVAFIQTERSVDRGRLTGIRFEVHSYDPRGDGRPLEAMFEGLLHEASHQYMHLATSGAVPPPWLDEGMASYFEGTRIDEHGKIWVGLPSYSHLIQLHDQLRRGGKPLRSTLHAERLTAAQYPVAWGVVYHLVHCMDAEGNYPYRDLLIPAIRALHERERNGQELFQEKVLTPAGRTFVDFEAEWSAAMQSLGQQERDPHGAVLHFTHAGHEWFAAGRRDAAEACYHEALLREDDHAPALLGMAQCAAGSGSVRADEAIVWSRRAFDEARKDHDRGTEARARIIAESLDPGGFVRRTAAEDRYRAEIERRIEAHLEAGHDRTALALARCFADAALDSGAFAALCHRLSRAGQSSAQRFTRLFDADSLQGWSTTADHFDVEDDELVGRALRPHAALLTLDRRVAPEFRLEGQVKLADANAVLGFLSLSPRRRTASGFALRPDAQAGDRRPPKEYQPFDTLAPGHAALLQSGYDPDLQRSGYLLRDPGAAKEFLVPQRWLPFALEREHSGRFSLTVAGQTLQVSLLPDQGEELSLAFLLYGGEVRLRDLRLVEFDRL